MGDLRRLCVMISHQLCANISHLFHDSSRSLCLDCAFVTLQETAHSQAKSVFVFPIRQVNDVLPVGAASPVLALSNVSAWLITPVEAIEIPVEPLSPADPMFAIGMAVGRSPVAMALEV
jgi:hypothetical protein